MCYRGGPYCYTILAKRLRGQQKDYEKKPSAQKQNKILETQVAIAGTEEGQARLIEQLNDMPDGEEKNALALKILHAAEIRQALLQKHLDAPVEKYKANKNTHRGYAHEYLLARAIIEHGDHARFAVDDKQVALKLIRKKYADEIKTKNAGEDMDIYDLAQEAAGHLPTAQGDVKFTETSANGGEVFDVEYTDVDGNRIAVSCKLAELEDKAHRFSTADYRIPAIDHYNRSMFTPDDALNKRSYEEALAQKGVEKSTYYSTLLGHLESALRGHGDDNKTLMRLTSERFIGNGGYYKTLNNGGVRYYPTNESTDKLSLVPDSIKIYGGTTIGYTVINRDAHGRDKQSYDIRARVKFKDGVTKPIKLSRDGSPGNISLSVGMKLA